MFGKLMSISDDLMPRYYELCLQQEMPSDLHPLDAKKRLAGRIVELYHDAAAAEGASAWWDDRSRDLSSVAHPTFQISGRRDLAGVCQAAYASLGQKRSGSDIRRLIQQGSVRIDGEKVIDPTSEPGWKDGQILKLDKKQAVQIALDEASEEG